MKPSKLRRHLQTKQSDCANKTHEYFQSRLVELNECKKSVKGFASCSSNEKTVLASYEVAHMIAKKRPPHMTTEELILPAVKRITIIMCGDKFTKEVCSISLQNNIIKR
jgi:hypothetical protein